MMEFDFALRFRLPETAPDPEAHLGALLDAGCDDATIGIGRPGRIALEFTREGRTARAAMHSAIRDVKRAIPGVEFLEASPDYVGVTDIANLLGVSRQRIRALTVENVSFPAAIHEGQIVLYHLADVLHWLEVDRRREVPTGLLEVARAAMRLNLQRDITDARSLATT